MSDPTSSSASACSTSHVSLIHLKKRIGKTKDLKSDGSTGPRRALAASQSRDSSSCWDINAKTTTPHVAEHRAAYPSIKKATVSSWLLSEDQRIDVSPQAHYQGRLHPARGPLCSLAGRGDRRLSGPALADA